MTDEPTALKGTLLPISRLVWVMTLLLTLLLWAMDAVVWAPVTTQPGDIAFSIIMPIGYFVIAGVIFWRASDRLMGFLTSLMLLILGPYLISGANNAVAELSAPLWRALNVVVVTIGYLSTIYFLFLFPNGRFVPGWLRLVSPVWTVVAVLTAVYDFFSQRSTDLTLLLFVAAIVAGVILQVYRYFNVSSAVERQQTKWVLGGMLGMMVPIVWWLLTEVIMHIPALTLEATHAFVFVALAILLFPLSIAFSILRYRLWDLSIIIQRTLVYGLLTAILALVYFGSVVVAQAAFRTVTGGESQLAIVISTLGIAALFTPLRIRLQHFIDRRFYRRKYDAEKTLDRFGARVRDEIEIGGLETALLHAVQETVQPESVGLWVRPPERGNVDG